MRIIKLSNQIKKRFIFLIIIFFCFSFSIFLISYSLKDQIAYFVSPEDIMKMNDIDDRYLKVGGLVKEGSLKFDDNQWNFEITDESKYVIKVVYTKSLPSLIEENKGIIVEGRMGKDNLFIAEIVLAKHDENYMPPEVADALEMEMNDDD